MGGSSSKTKGGGIDFIIFVWVYSGVTMHNTTYNAMWVLFLSSVFVAVEAGFGDIFEDFVTGSFYDDEFCFREGAAETVDKEDFAVAIGYPVRTFLSRYCCCGDFLRFRGRLSFLRR